MRFDTDLRAAGQRAAAQPVPSPPPLTQIEAGADRHRAKRRLMGSGVAAVALVAASLPFALNLGSSTTVQEVVAGGTGFAASAQVDSPAPAGEPAPPAALAQDDDRSESDDEHTITLDFTSEGDGLRVDIRLRSGDDAALAASAAAADADETIEVDGITVWISNDGDRRTVSALVEPTEFIEVTGPAEQFDALIDVLREGRFDRPQGLLDFEEFGRGDFDFNFDFDSEDGFTIDGDLGDIDELLGEIEQELGELDRLIEGNLPKIEQFFEEGGFHGRLDDWENSFEGCISIKGEGNGDFSFEYPEGCSTND